MNLYLNLFFFRSTSTPGYVTIGSVRYGVRFASSAPSKEVVPSRVEASNEKQADDGDFCCDVMQLAWPRVVGSPLPPSKIPLPNAEKSQAINKRVLSGKVNEERAAPVYRNTLEVTRSKRTPVGCFAAGSVESSMKATPPTPNSLRRPAIGRPSFKFGSSSQSDGETSKLIATDSKEDLTVGSPASQFQLTLDKIHKFRFGASSSGSDDKSSGKKKRSSDKTERLRELTDKLLHSRTPSCPDRKKPPICNSSPPKVSNKTQSAASSFRNLFGSTTSLIGSQKDGSNKRESVDCAKFEAEDAEGGPRKADCDISDGKRVRGPHADIGSRGKLSSIGSLTFPRVTQVDAATSVSPPPDKVTERTSSTPSVDSAVGSDEGFVLGSSNNIVNISDSHKGSRSLTYPFTKKASKSDEIPFSSIDGNGLKSLQQYPSMSRELADVKEELVPSESAITDSSSETIKDVSTETPDNLVFQCAVPAGEPPDKPCRDNTTPTQSLETLEKEINELIIQQNVSDSKPEIYVTTWPKDAWKRSDFEGSKSFEYSETETAEEAEAAKERTNEKPRLSCQSSDEKDDDVAPKRYQQLFRNDSLSEGESDHGDRWRDRTCSPSPLFSASYDLSDGEGRTTGDRAPRRYSKRPLRGPYGQMLEAEMKKPEATRLLSKMQDLKFLEEYIAPVPENGSSPEMNRPSSESRLTCPRSRFGSGRSFDDSQLQNVYSTNPRTSSKRKVSANLPFTEPGSGGAKGPVVCHQRTTSSPSQLEAFSAKTHSLSTSPGSRQNEATQELLAALLKGSSERNFLAEETSLIHQSKVSHPHFSASFLSSRSFNFLSPVPVIPLAGSFLQSRKLSRSTFRHQRNDAIQVKLPNRTAAILSLQQFFAGFPRPFYSSPPEKFSMIKREKLSPKNLELLCIC